MDDLIQEIRTLEDKSSYFGRILNLSNAENITQKEAWAKIEQRREELGLKPKYSTLCSFYMAKSKHLSKGELIRFDFGE